MIECYVKQDIYYLTIYILSVYQTQKLFKLFLIHTVMIPESGPFYYDRYRIRTYGRYIDDRYRTRTYGHHI